MINVGLTSVPESLDPVNVRIMEHFLLLQSISQTLVRVSEQGKIVADLARSWSVKDGVEYEFNLNENAKFFDGTPVTAQSLVSSLSRHFYPQNKSAVGGYLKDIILGAENLEDGKFPKGLEVISEKKVKITLRKPYPPFLFVLAMPGFSIVKIDNKEIIGSGPMKPEFQEKEKTWILKRNEHYAGINPMVERILVRELPNTSILTKLLSQNEVDVVLGLSPSEVQALDLQSTYKTVKTQSLAVVHMYYNTSSQPFSDKNFRKDLSRLIQSVGHEPKNMTPFHEPQNNYLPRGVMPQPYYTNSNEKVSPETIRTKWSQKFKDKTFNCILWEKAFSKEFFRSLEKAMSDAGLKFHLKVVDGKELVKSMFSQDYNLIGGRYVGNFPDPDGFTDPIRQDSSLKYGSFPSGPFFQQIDTVKFDSDKKKRLNSYAETLKKLEDEHYIIPLYRLKIPIIHNDKINIPETSFRYEGELWKIFWEKQ